MLRHLKPLKRPYSRIQPITNFAVGIPSSLKAAGEKWWEKVLSNFARFVFRYLLGGIWTEWDIVCRNPDGTVAWAERVKNRFFNTGEIDCLKLVFRGEAPFGAQFFGRLYNDTPTDTDALSDLTGEPTSNGYAPLPWSRNTTDWGIPTTVGTVGETVGMKKSFSASGAGWGPVASFVFATTSDNSGRPVAWVILSQPRSVPGGQSLDFTPTGRMRGVTS